MAFTKVAQATFNVDFNDSSFDVTLPGPPLEDDIIIFAHCADPNPARCTLVPPAEYDETRGYVNAVGSLIVRYHGLTLHTFSPLGEAVFSELPDAAPGHTELELDRHGS